MLSIVLIAGEKSGNQYRKVPSLMESHSMGLDKKHTNKL